MKGPADEDARAFLDWCDLSGFTAETLRTYRSALARLEDAAGRPLLALTTDDLAAYLCPQPPQRRTRVARSFMPSAR